MYNQIRKSGKSSIGSKKVASVIKPIKKTVSPITTSSPLTAPISQKVKTAKSGGMTKRTGKF